MTNGDKEALARRAPDKLTHLVKPSVLWGLYEHSERKPTCKRCLELAARHGLTLPGGATEKRTQGDER